MSALLAAILLPLAGAPTGLGEVLIDEFVWSELQAEGRLPAGDVVPADPDTPFERLEISGTKGAPSSTTILVIEGPETRDSSYAVRGRISYRGVEDTGYLEMWSHFPGERRYFSRTLGGHGRLRSIKGSSKWRDFELPFFLGQEKATPERLVINVVLPGEGSVTLGPLRLVELAEPWWDPGRSYLIGAIGGPFIGVFCPLVLWLASRGRARWFADGGVVVMVAAGVGALVVGLVAAFSSQPYAIWYPPLLVGILLLPMAPAYVYTRMRFRKRLENTELRKMQARDA